MWDSFKVRGNVTTDVNWLFSESSAELGNIGNRSIVQCPQCVFVKGSMPFPLDRPISMQLESKSYWRNRFCSCILLKRSGLSFSRTDMIERVARANGGPPWFYSKSRRFLDVRRTLSLVMLLAPAGALPKAKLILCSCNSASVTCVRRDVSRTFFSSGSALMSPRNCFLSAICVLPFAFSSERTGVVHLVYNIA